MTTIIGYPVVNPNTQYVSVAEAKAYARITSTDLSDDSVIAILLDAVARYIDREAQQVFYLTTETRLFDMPKGDILMVDKPLQSVTTLTNGDAAVIPSTQYILWPANDLPKYAIQLLSSLGISWKPTAGIPLQCISVAGVWGLSCPADIKEAALIIFKAAYNRRFGENMNSTTLITQGGIIITPEDVPAKALQIIHNNRRASFA